MKKLHLLLILLFITISAQATINVSITNPNNSKDTICQGLSQLITTNISGNTGTVTYQWKKRTVSFYIIHVLCNIETILYKIILQNNNLQNN